MNKEGKMEQKIVCHRCKSILAPGSSYCPQCGEKITKDDYVAGDTVLLNPIYLLPGTVLHLKYRINGVIGQGGFGITYDGTDIKLDMHVAIKEYFPNPMASRQVTVSTEVTCGANTESLYKQGMNNFLKEAKNMAKYAGEENFVSVHDYFVENNTAYIIMEFVDGQNLKQYLQKHGRLTVEESMPIIMPVMNALEKIHSRGMIHRDVSPSNIMLLPDGRVRLLDFGAARDVTLETQNMTTMSAVYKYGYSPIEQQTMGMNQGPYTDIYALCATLYEMLTGNVPVSPFKRAYEGVSLIPPSSLGVRINAVQEETLLRGLAVNGADRIQTIKELRDGLIWTGVMAPPDTQGSGSSLKIVLGVLVGFLVIAIGAAAFSMTRSKKKDEPAADAYLVAEEPADEPSEPVGTPDSGIDDTEVTTEEPEPETGTQSSGIEAESVSTVGGWSDQEDSEEKEHVEPTERPDRIYLYRGHSYAFYNADEYDLTSYAEVKRFCHEQGGHLAVINDQAENDYLFGLVRDNYAKTVFFGYSDENGESDWEWDGDSSTYSNWSPGMPDNGASYGGDEDYAEFNYERGKDDQIPCDGTWNDAPFMNNTSVFICEWEYELD